MRIILNNGRYVNRLKVIYSDNSSESSLLLDDLTGSTGGFSLRKLKSSYSGSAIQVRRASDNSTQDIGFVNNELDTTTLSSFCSGTDGFVTIWYDQSGNGYDLTQSTSVNQFKIVNSGSIYTVNGKPAFFGNEDYLENSTKTASSTSTVFTVHKAESDTTNASVVSFPAATSHHIGLYYWYSDSGKPFGFNTWNNDSWGYDNASADFTTQSLWTALFKEGDITTNGVKLFRNSIEKSLSQVRGTSLSRTLNDGVYVGRGGSPSNQDSDGYYQEIIMWDADYSLTNRTTIENNINTYYSIYGLLLDDLSGSTGGFSLRKLKSSYSGNAIQVRRASDNTTQDIGFVNNQLDTATLNSFCSGTNGFVTIWYNQSDTSNNAIQTTAANQPKIYDSSTGCETNSGKPSINFIGANDNWLEVTDTSFGNIGDVISNFSVSHLTTGTGNIYPTIIGKGIYADGTHQFFRFPDSNKFTIRVDGTNHSTGYDNFGATRLISNINTLSTVSIYADSVQILSTGNSQDLVGTNTLKFYIGKNSQGSANNFRGFIQEILLFSNDQASNRTTIETNINTNYSIYGLLLDDLSGSAGAFSLRKLKSSYSGNAIQVRRGSDNTTQDIGFVNNELDTTTLNTFCGGTDGFVTIWYDQSGNANNVVQTTASKQPKIYDSITGIYLLNGKPSMEMGSASSALVYSNLPGSTSYSVSSVFSAIDSSQYTKLLSIGPDSQTAGVWFTINTAGTTLEWVVKDTGFAGNGYNNTSGPSVIGNSRIIPNSITTQNILTTVLSSSNAKMFKNGSEISYRIQRTGNCYNTAGDLIIGNSPNNANTMKGRLQELVIWQSDEASSISDINTNTNNFYNTY